MENALALPLGTLLVGDYRIERVLGAGGFGITYLARELSLDRWVTIKEYFPADFAAREEGGAARAKSESSLVDYNWGLERFIEEAQALAQFDHPNIVRVYRYFRASSTAYMVLQWEEGQSLKSRLMDLNRAPRQNELDQILAPLLDALELMHSANVLHRDIAPDNIIVRKDGSPVLIDFGSARREMAQQSKTVSALVKPGYSPYEQYAETGRQQGPWTDIYSLGATLYMAMTGRRPADSPSRMVQDELVPAQAASLAAYRPGFLSAVDRALRLRIDERPQSVGAWRHELMAPAESPQAADSPRRPLAVGNLREAERAVPPPPAPQPPPQALAPPLEAARRRTPSPGSTVKLETQARPRPIVIGKPPPAAEVPVAQPALARTPVEPRPQLRRRFGGLIRRLAHELRPDEIERGKPARAEAVAHAFVPEHEPVLAGPIEHAEVQIRTRPPQPLLPASAPDAPAPGRARKRKASAKSRLRTTWRWRGLLAKFIIGAAIVAAGLSYREWQPKLLVIGQRLVHSQSVTVPLAADPVVAGIIKAHDGPAEHIAFYESGRALVSTGADGSLRVWNAANGRLIRTLELKAGPARSLGVEGRRALTGHEDGSIGLWSLESGEKLAAFKRNDAAIWALAFAGSSTRFVAAAHDWTVTVWEASQPAAPVQVLSGHESAAQAVAFSGAVNLIASAGADKTVRLWNAATGELQRTLKGHRDFITTVAFSPDGQLVASAGLDRTIRLWSTASGRSYRSLYGNKGNVSGLAFSPDGQWIASAGEDGSVRVWDHKRGRSVKSFLGHAGKVTALAFAPDGRRLASAGADGTLRLWDTENLSRKAVARDE